MSIQDKIVNYLQSHYDDFVLGTIDDTGIYFYADGHYSFIEPDEFENFKSLLEV